MRGIIALAVVVRVSTAVAEQNTAPPPEPSPPRSPRLLVGLGVGGTGMAGDTSDPAFKWYAEALVRPIARVPVLALVSFDEGSWSGNGDHEDFGSGSWWQLRFGVELRECTRRQHACLFVDGAVGVMQVTGHGGTIGPFVQFPQTATTASARIGLDVGSRYVRFRVGWQQAAPVTHRFHSIDTENAPTYYTTDLGTPTGPELGLAAAF